MKRPKFYVVWVGINPGVFDDWETCKKQVAGYPGALYKSFATRELADKAFNNPNEYFINEEPETNLSEEEKTLIGNPLTDSICVDGAWNTETGVVEYQGIHTKNGETLFKSQCYDDGTNNIVEFLGIVHALAYCKQKNLSLPIYSDSKTAIGWVKNKHANTNHKKSDRNTKLFELLDRAVKWLKENDYPNEILKWETKAWGENPADFGRK